MCFTIVGQAGKDNELMLDMRILNGIRSILVTNTYYAEMESNNYLCHSSVYIRGCKECKIALETLMQISQAHS
jgi:hypothetical protein